MQEWRVPNPNLSNLRIEPHRGGPKYGDFCVYFVQFEEFSTPVLRVGRPRWPLPYTKGGPQSWLVLELAGEEGRAVEAIFEDLDARMAAEMRKIPPVGFNGGQRLIHHHDNKRHFFCKVSKQCKFDDLFTHKRHAIEDMRDGPAVTRVRLKTLVYKRGALHESWIIEAIQGLSKQRHIINLLMRGLDQMGYVFPKQFYARLYDLL